MKTVAVILARAGSKGIPKKNICSLKGQPLISYTIQASLKSKVDETWVCTDGEEIATISKKYGARVLMRPSNISTDTCKSEEALLYFCDKVDFNILVFIQPTSPLLTWEYINRGLDLYQSSNADSVFSAYREHWLPRWKFNTNTPFVDPYFWKTSKRPRRQDAEDLLVENGAFYITTKENLRSNRLRYSGNVIALEMPYSKSFQVDTLDDLELISKLL